MFEQIVHGVESIGGSVRNSFMGVGRYSLLLREIGYWMFRRPFRYSLIIKQLEFVGNKSLHIILLSSFFTGAVFGLQLGTIFGIFKAEGLMGAATGKAMALELGPVMCGFIVTGRAGASMAAEIATMRVNEQLDAMEAMGIDPVSYLIVPRVIAGTIMLPIVTAIFLFVGVVGTFLVGRLIFNVDTAFFMDQLTWLVWWSDVQKGLIKAAFFGLIFSTIACYKGYHAKGGAKGVGEATTDAVVAGLLSILISDFFISFLQRD